MSLNGIILGMGNPLLDIAADVSLELLQKYDLKPNDAILAEEKHMPLYSELENDHKVDYTPGGATQNAIKVAQWALKEPGTCVFSGCIKDDKYGKILENSCREFGVTTAYQYNTGSEPTGLCACLITDQNRSLVTNLGASCKFTIDHLNKPEIWKLVESARFYYISGFFISSCHEALIKVAKHSLDNNKTFTFNLSAVFLMDFMFPQVSEALEYCDIIFGNEMEALKLSEKAGFGTNDMKQIAMKTSQLPYKKSERKRTVVITQGPLPVIIMQNGQCYEFPVSKMEASAIVDTIGAGDAFVGGFLAELVRGRSLEQCVTLGNRLAQMVIQRRGCTLPSSVPNDI